MRGDEAADERLGAGVRASNPRARLIAAADCESALSVFTGVQWVLFVSTLAAAVLAIAAAPSETADAARLVLACAYLTYAAWRVILVLSSVPSTGTSSAPDAGLPCYTIVCPLYREAAMVEQLAAALDAIDYPRDRLQAFLVLESDDEDTRVAAALAVLPGFVQVLVAPPGVPRTKPRACNLALEQATGELLVIYDAEDRPDPLQLREAAARFAAAPPEVVCLQAPLRVAPAEGWFQRQFALEYAAQFEVTLPAMARLRLPFPLGGTSNHFRTARLREAGGWDAWNVTEDADLGFRFAARGWRVETLTRPTWEAPPATLWTEWMPQRTRWLKGYMQTWTVRTRRPWVRGWRMPLGLATTLGVAIGSALLHGLIWAWVGVQLVMMAIAQDVGGVRWLDVLVLVAGWWTWALTAQVGARRAGLKVSVFDYYVAPAYWALHTLAAVRAVWQFIRCPFWWDKTPHQPLSYAPRRGLTFLYRRVRVNAS